MLFRKSISNTKNFFKNTVESVKSFFSGGYQRLPKTPRCSLFPCSGTRRLNMKTSSCYEDLDKFYTDFTNQWDDHADKDHTNEAKKRSKKKVVFSIDTKQDNEQVYSSNPGSFMKFAKATKNNQVERRDDEDAIIKRKCAHEGKRQDYSWINKGMREEAAKRASLVEERLKELEMMDVSNLEHVLDIEEVLHYYSRLTCPAYVDIVDQFFMDMYSEFSGHRESKLCGNNSKLRERLKKGSI